MAFVKKAFYVPEKEDDYPGNQQMFLGMATFTPPPEVTTVPGAIERCIFAVPATEEKPARTLDAGTFCQPTLWDLRASTKGAGRVELGNDTGEAQQMHIHALHGGVIQAASQFNYLEFAQPTYTPEKGITSWEWDRTQGPACATSCAPGSVYRNYLLPLDSAAVGRVVEPHKAGAPAHQRGQTADLQASALTDLEALAKRRLIELGLCTEETYVAPWRFQNGYLYGSDEGLTVLNKALEQEPKLKDELGGALRICVQLDTEVSNESAGMTWGQQSEGKWGMIPVEGRPEVIRVTQAYCSAVSIKYDKTIDKELWAPVAQLILDAAYEATVRVGVLDKIAFRKARGPEATRPYPDVQLTLVGGGAFGNDPVWIRDACRKAQAAINAEATDASVPVTTKVMHFMTVPDTFQELDK